MDTFDIDTQDILKCGYCGGSHTGNYKGEACHDHYRRELAELRDAVAWYFECKHLYIRSCFNLWGEHEIELICNHAEQQLRETI